MDTVPKHASKSIMDHLTRHQLKGLPWPSQSLHLISTENLWTDLRRAVVARKPRNVKELGDLRDEKWRKIPPTRTERLLAEDPLKATLWTTFYVLLKYF